jgi:hypothetical protein
VQFGPLALRDFAEVCLEKTTGILSVQPTIGAAPRHKRTTERLGNIPGRFLIKLSKLRVARRTRTPQLAS